MDPVWVQAFTPCAAGHLDFLIYEQLGIVPRFIGTGEEPEAFSVFEKERFVSEVL